MELKAILKVHCAIHVDKGLVCTFGRSFAVVLLSVKVVL